ncbi:MAG: DNA primase [Eubacteriales bacterium SKADARSKE-1]|nr:DNA primase [Eubacteriales bacterium SKADARSKE-1]
MISDGFIEELKLKSDIVDIASYYVNLKRQGKNLWGLCPFHAEKTPSFSVFPDSGSFYCFGCGAGGDVITFIERIENLDYIEAVKFLADKAGINMPQNDGKSEDLSNLRRRIFEANREAARFFHNTLYSEKGKEALKYLKIRGLTDNTIKKFGLGFAPNSRYELGNHLKSQGFKPYEIIQANLGVSKENKEPWSRFFDRVMFPIIDLRGNVVAFGGRTMLDIKPKYLNTSDTIIFKKSSNLFSLNFAKNESTEKLILVEGYMDVIALYQAGFKNTVATLGTALTPEQAKLMSRYAKEIIICYDSDLAGQKAAQRAIDLLRQTDVLIKVVTVPNGKDPDEFIRLHGSEGPTRFNLLLNSSNNDVEYILKKEALKYDIETTDGKIAYLKSSIKILSKLNNRLEQDIFAGKLSEKVGVDKSTIMMQLLKEHKKNKILEEKKEFLKIQQDLSAKRDFINKDKSKNLRAAVAEEALIAFIINNPDIANNIFLKLTPEKFCTDFNKRVYSCLFERKKANRPFSLIDLTLDFTKEEIAKIASFLAIESRRNSTIKAAYEYIDVILYESEKFSEVELNLADENKIREYMLKLKSIKNRGKFDNGYGSY